MSNLPENDQIKLKNISLIEKTKADLLKTEKTLNTIVYRLKNTDFESGQLSLYENSRSIALTFHTLKNGILEDCNEILTQLLRTDA